MGSPNAAMLGLLSSAFLLLVLISQSLPGCYSFPMSDSVDSLLTKTPEEVGSTTSGEKKNSKGEPNSEADVSVSNSDSSTDSEDSRQWEAADVGIAGTSPKSPEYMATTRYLSLLRSRADSLQFKLLRFFGLLLVIAIGALAAAYFFEPGKPKFNETVMRLGSQLLNNFPKELSFIYKDEVFESSLVQYAPVDYEPTPEEVEGVLSNINDRLEALVHRKSGEGFRVYAPMAADYIVIRKR